MPARPDRPDKPNRPARPGGGPPRPPRPQNTPSPRPGAEGRSTRPPHSGPPPPHPDAFVARPVPPPKEDPNGERGKRKRDQERTRQAKHTADNRPPLTVWVGSQFPDGQMEAEFEDDGRAAYFYLVHPEEGRVRSVWVYNRLPAPEEPAWDEEAEQNLAPLQPANLTSHPEPHPPFRQKDIEIYWDEEGMLAALFYAGEPFAVVTMDEEDPGYSRLATEDGPLARAWNEEVEALFMDEDEEEEGEEEA